jgi:hypothetical protein
MADKLQISHYTANRFICLFCPLMQPETSVLEIRFQLFEAKAEKSAIRMLISSKSIFLQPTNKTLRSCQTLHQE